MRLKVENIRLRDILTEATFVDAFTQIKKGDVLTVKTGKQIFKAQIISKFSNQITFEYGGQYYLITNNSFRDDSLETQRLVIDADGRTKRTAKGPTITGIYNIIVTRNGKPVTGVTPEKGRTAPEGKKQAQQKDNFQERYNDIKSELNSFNEGDRMQITTGKIITKGTDKGSLARNTVTEIMLEIVKKTSGGSLKGKIISVSGADEANYSELKNQFIFIGSESIVVTNEGLTLVVKTISNGQPNKTYIKNVFSISNEGVEIGDSAEKLTDKDVWDVIQNSPQLRNMVYRSPSLLSKIFGKGAEFDPNALDLLFKSASDLGGYKPGDTVQFSYYGNPINIAKDINLERGGTYVGKFDGKSTIIMKSTNRKDMLELRIVGMKGDKNVAQVTYKSTKLNKLEEKDLGRVIITIIDKKKEAL